MSPDIINACFELGGAALNTMNIIQIRKDKSVRGVSVVPTIMFSIWAVWNMYYYSHLHQYYSVGAAVLLGVVNFTWVYYYFKYTPKSISVRRLKNFYRIKGREIK
ncbi:MAG: hypothetical protein WC967_13165 [Balneolaceae bacterium]